LVVGVIIHYEVCEVHEGYFYRRGRKVTQSIYDKDNQAKDKDGVAT